jgi:ClpP class serine protease
MTGNIVFLIILVLIVLQPIVRQKLLEAARLKVIKRIERERNSRVVTLIHRQETMSLLGFPVFRFIDVNDAEQVMQAIHMTDKEMELDLVVHTPGGLVLASLQIARALKRRPGKVRVFIPHHAMSGGTLIALAADQIVMSPHAVLGPVDPQVGQFPAAALLDVVSRKPIHEIDDHTLMMADQGKKATEQIRHAVRELLEGTVEAEQADRIARTLSEGHWTHDYPLTFDDLNKLGLPVTDQMPESVMRLLTLYPQPLRRQQGVEFRPEKRKSGDRFSDA